MKFDAEGKMLYNRIKKEGCDVEILCPICAQRLTRQENTCRCPDGHAFDVARQGYVNLLPVQQKRSLNPGDTQQQVLARRTFLDGGFYEPIVDAVCSLLQEHSAVGPVLDIGCGEGYYSRRIAQALDAPLTGLDISKEAVRYAAGRYKDAQWLCASAARLPVADGSVGLVSSLFALTVPEEFRRVLIPGGGFLQVLAAPDHLLGLKSVIYPELTHKPKDSTPQVPGFVLEESRPVRFTFTVQGQQVQNLLSMTPHVYRIGKEGAQRLAETQQLTDTASCVLNFSRRES